MLSMSSVSPGMMRLQIDQVVPSRAAIAVARLLQEMTMFDAHIKARRRYIGGDL